MTGLRAANLKASLAVLTDQETGVGRTAFDDRVRRLAEPALPRRSDLRQRLWNDRLFHTDQFEKHESPDQAGPSLASGDIRRPDDSG